MNPFTHTHIWSKADFRKLLRSQRDLADRHGTPCAVVTMNTRQIDRAQRKTLLAHLDERVRASDSLGRFQDDLGLLLRSTDLDGANCFADSLRGHLESHKMNVALSVLMYPGPDLGPGKKASTQAAQSLGPHLMPHLGAPQRLLDISVSSGLLLLLSPILLAVSAAVRLDSVGPIIFRQQRLGRGGKRFTFYKFRSMSDNAEQAQAGLETSNEKDGPIFKIKHDPRITRVGRFIRRWSLDELPQLFNVLRGDMTLVGPRPPKPNEVAQYEPWQRRRLDLVGGLTCIWQVSGRSDVSFIEWMRMDRRYANTRSLLGDFRLLAQTVPALLTARGAY